MVSRRSALAVAILVCCGVGTSGAANAANAGNRNGVGPVASPDTVSTSGSTSVRSLITFDTGTAPCLFDETAPLRDEYADLGVRFRGATSSTGGAVLNECGSFGVRAHSGQEFLAFNALTYATDPQRISFSSLQRSVQMYVANGFGPGPSRYTLTGWRQGLVVARTSITTTVRGWVLIRVAQFRGMDRVTLTASVPDGDTFVVDDLQLNAL